MSTTGYAYATHVCFWRSLPSQLTNKSIQHNLSKGYSTLEDQVF
ncbi:hypothetical protein COO91_01659 [Nostoc flagelliforme CCNUN1]|uniref:Uncharacterized protein n=1 Tax=Nostoc flagelliforme CCNUN1 TaxID=2038116 RepID=A0A2K8SK20_9NOSO|nr:hypothetical protein COO91_01659 [Nostoc flagelliforme CCNUN1]